MAILGFLVAGLVWYGEEIVQKNNPITISFDRVNVNPGKMNFSSDGFNIAFALMDND
jgi:hypothetical protein